MGATLYVSLNSWTISLLIRILIVQELRIYHRKEDELTARLSLL